MTNERDLSVSAERQKKTELNILTVVSLMSLTAVNNYKRSLSVPSHKFHTQWRCDCTQQTCRKSQRNRKCALPSFSSQGAAAAEFVDDQLDISRHFLSERYGLVSLVLSTFAAWRVSVYGRGCRGSYTCTATCTFLCLSVPSL